MIKVFFIINCFSKGGGAEALLTTIVNNLNPDKYEIGIMEIVHDTVKVEPTNSNIKIYPYYVEANAPDRKAKMYYVYHEWDKVIEEYVPQDYDLYVSFNYLKPTFLLPPGKKNIAWIHGGIHLLAQEDKKEEWKLQNRAFSKAAKIVSISDETTNLLETVFPEHKEKIKVLYNGIHIEKIKSKAEEACNVKLKHPALLAVGRLDRNKNPLRFLNIFEQVHQRNCNVHLYYLGYGELEETVKNKAQEKGLSNYVHLLGYYNNPFPIMLQCDLIGMFSVSEGFSLALAEGLALGKPFVSTPIGGSGILANEQRCGRIVEVDDEASDAILELLEADRKNIENECYDSIQRFGVKAYIRQVEELFEEVLKG